MIIEHHFIPIIVALIVLFLPLPHLLISILISWRGEMKIPVPINVLVVMSIPQLSNRVLALISTYILLCFFCRVATIYGSMTVVN